MASEGRPRVELEAAVLTDVGVVRDHNEDSAHVDPKNQFFIVADGMGGHAAGEVASAMAVDRVRQALEAERDVISEFANAPSDEGRKKLVSLLETSVRDAHKAVYDRGVRETDKHGMGTTLDVVVVAGPEAFVAHVGDSRTYLIRDTRAAQITTDHTVAEVLVIEGKLSLEEAQISPLRTILVNAIGVAADVGIEMAHVQLRKDDHLLLCSDGLHDYFPMEQELADCISKMSPTDSITELVTQAKERGGHDNITGIVVRVIECQSMLQNTPKSPEQLLAEEVTATLPLDSLNTEDGTIEVARDGHEDDSDEVDTVEADAADADPLAVTVDIAINDSDRQALKDAKSAATKGAKPTKAQGEGESAEGDEAEADQAAESQSKSESAKSESVKAKKRELDPAIFEEPTLEHKRPTEADMKKD